MPKNRLIATLLVHEGNVVQTRKFKRTNMVGSPFTAVDFFNTWAVDEIMVLEISYGPRWRDRHLEIVENLSRRCFVPLSVGGKIEDIERVAQYTRVGADKVVVNTGAVRRPPLLTEIAESFGKQCLIVSIDAAKAPSFPSGYQVVIDNGREPVDLDVIEWASRAVELGAGEIMINAIDHDGDKRGYDIPLVRNLSDTLDAPLIAMGGVGEWRHLVDGVEDGKADAVAAGNIFHYTEHSTKKAKEFMANANVPVRASSFFKVNMPRRPKYKPF